MNLMFILNFIAMITHTMPALPFEPTALEPHMSKETIDYHYGKHLQTYVTNLNNLIPGTEFENASLEKIIESASGPIFNNGAQVYNHTFFFNQFSASPKLVPSGALAAAIDRDFGSLAKFKEDFSKAAVGVFGSGWAWLVKDKEGKLSIRQESNAGNPIKAGFVPLMTFDVWEHAYYVDYRNRRAEFVEKLWAILDWSVIESRY